MQFYPHRSVEEQANRLPIELQEAYRKSPIDRITISNGEKTIELTGYADYSYHEEKSYKTQPVRTNDGKINEIEEYETFLTPRLIIKYNMMNIKDYRETMKLLKSSNSFIVRCYDPVYDRVVANRMYVAPTNMPVIYQQYLMALGIRDFNIEMIGTNIETEFSIKVDVDWESLFEKYSAPIDSIWRDVIEEIPILRIFEDSNYIHFRGYAGFVLYYQNGEIVSPDDKIVDGEEYYVASL